MNKSIASFNPVTRYNQLAKKISKNKIWRSDGKIVNLTLFCPQTNAENTYRFHDFMNHKSYQMHESKNILCDPVPAMKIHHGTVHNHQHLDPAG